MITLCIPSTGLVVTAAEARKYVKKHVVVSRKDLKKIAKLAKQLGFYEQLKALNVTLQEITLREED